MSNVLVLFCGGTIIMEENKQNGQQYLKPPDNKGEAINILQNISPSLAIAEENISYIANIDSTEINHNHWEELIRTIKDNYYKYDGFVVTHGTDTLAYTASALTIGLRGLNKPIVLTGSQIPGSAVNSDARRNLVNAYILAQKNIRGVYVVFDERIILGSRATKTSESKLDAFDTVTGDDFGEIKVDFRFDKDLWEKVEVNEDDKKELDVIDTGFEADIFTYSVTPASDPSDLTFLLENDRVQGLLLKGYGPGNIPRSFESFFKQAEQEGFPIVISTQCVNGETLIGYYESGCWFKDYTNIIDGKDQSVEMLTVKMQYALNKSNQIKEIENIVGNNYFFELGEEEERNQAVLQ